MMFPGCVKGAHASQRRCAPCLKPFLLQRANQIEIIANSKRRWNGDYDLQASVDGASGTAFQQAFTTHVGCNICTHGKIVLAAGRPSSHCVS